MEATQHIQRILQRLPDSPGVYQHFDSDGKLLYIGKAKNLKKRVSSYFNKKTFENRKTQILVQKIADIQFIVVPTEVDALLLENSLIKEHQPRYNIELKDDKTYPSIVIRKEAFPRIYATRNLIQDGSEYFGPFTSVKTMNTVLALCKSLYPLMCNSCRSISIKQTKSNNNITEFRSCLESDLGKCTGPCFDETTRKDYAASISAIRKLLKGQLSEVIHVLKEQMSLASEEFRFEEAEAFKRKLAYVQQYKAKNTVVHPGITDVEVYSIVEDTTRAYVNFLKVQNGAIIQGHTSEVQRKLAENTRELLETAIVRMRDKFQSHSKTIYTPFPIDLPLKGVQIHVPQRGDKLRLVEMSERNAKYIMLDRRKQQEQVDPEAAQNRIMETLQKDLHLKEKPVHIECFDNSNIQGTNPASACVVFKKAKPSKSDYRKFNIKTVQGPDDFASMAEVVHRRYKRLLEEGESLPQLIIVDGGKGQLSSAVGALNDLGILGKVAIIGIAKRLEELYFPGDSIALHLDKRSESLKLIQRMRDEAHRFSLAHHRKRRSAAALHSALDDIAGVGPATRQKLMSEFGTVDAIKKANEAALLRVVNLRVAQAIRTWASEQDDQTN